MHSRTVTPRDVDPPGEFEVFRVQAKITEGIIRSNTDVSVNTITPSKSTEKSVIHNMTRSEVLLLNNSQLANDTEEKYKIIPDITIPLVHNSILFKEIIEDTGSNAPKSNEPIHDSHIDLHSKYKDAIANSTKYIKMKLVNASDHSINVTPVHLDGKSVKIIKNRTVVNQMLSKRLHNDSIILKNFKRPNYCPLWPEKLVGRMDMDVAVISTEISPAVQESIAEGGVFKPEVCSPRERTAIIIPYRNRENHLKVLLSHLHEVLQRQMIEYGIYVIEMAFPAQFNRGLLANVGFLTSSSIRSYTCYIIHDVDLLMMDDRNMYRCGRVPRHLTASNTKYTKRLPYLAYFGGVVAFTPEQFWKVNGFSNLYFGWGGEDDDMVYRIFHTGQHFSRPKPIIGGYTAIEHDSDSTNPVNPNRQALVNSARRRMVDDGVRSVMYQRLALEFKPLYTWVYISVQEAKIMHKYQEFLEDPE
ncbi:Beta-1 [Mactra antiquata]